MSGKKQKGEGRAGSGTGLDRALDLSVDYRQQIASYIRTMKFRRKAFGGLDEADVLRKIEELNRLYESLLLQERAKWQAELQKVQTINQRDGSSDLLSDNLGKGPAADGGGICGKPGFNGNVSEDSSNGNGGGGDER